MKTKLLLLFILTFSLAGSCESDPIQEKSCDCEKVNYIKKVKLEGVTAIFYYEKSYVEPVECQAESKQYIQTDSNKFYKIECK